MLWDMATIHRHYVLFEYEAFSTNQIKSMIETNATECRRSELRKNAHYDSDTRLSRCHWQITIPSSRLFYNGHIS